MGVFKEEPFGPIMVKLKKVQSRKGGEVVPELNGCTEVRVRDPLKIMAYLSLAMPFCPLKLTSSCASFLGRLFLGV